MEGKGCLDNFIVGTVPTVLYIPNFVTDSEQAQLLNNIYQAPTSKWKSLMNRRLQSWGGVVHAKGLLSQDLPPWITKITQRIYEESGLFPAAINHVLVNEYLPNQGIMPHQDGPAYFPVAAIISLGSPVVMDFTPHSRFRLRMHESENSVEPENSDGRSSGIDKWLNFHHPFSVLLMPRSLMIFKDEAYSDYLHGIKDSDVQQCNEAVNVFEALQHDKIELPVSSSEEAADQSSIGGLKNIHRTTSRISLTCRLVLKVHKNLFKF
ncbi:uncharacterized protein LOC131149611 isoform X2 [Malania oleifera]|nr:uncharacterized protein LOC131149611 isoform X2 [Malania oleifera]XP_057956201.1 uncharacterized protein LOC131149611 isoform X2 [Malania oleifera]